MYCKTSVFSRLEYLYETLLRLPSNWNPESARLWFWTNGHCCWQHTSHGTNRPVIKVRPRGNTVEPGPPPPPPPRPAPPPVDFSGPPLIARRRLVPINIVNTVRRRRQHCYLPPNVRTRPHALSHAHGRTTSPSRQWRTRQYGTRFAFSLVHSLAAIGPTSLSVAALRPVTPPSRQPHVAGALLVVFLLFLFAVHRTHVRTPKQW